MTTIFKILLNRHINFLFFEVLARRTSKLQIKGIFLNSSILTFQKFNVFKRPAFLCDHVIIIIGTIIPLLATTGQRPVISKLRGALR